MIIPLQDGRGASARAAHAEGDLCFAAILQMFARQKEGGGSGEGGLYE